MEAERKERIRALLPIAIGSLTVSFSNILLSDPHTERAEGHNAIWEGSAGSD